MKTQHETHNGLINKEIIGIIRFKLTAYVYNRKASKTLLRVTSYEKQPPKLLCQFTWYVFINHTKGTAFKAELLGLMRKPQWRSKLLNSLVTLYGSSKGFLIIHNR